MGAISQVAYCSSETEEPHYILDWKEVRKGKTSDFDPANLSNRSADVEAIG